MTWGFHVLWPFLAFFGGAYAVAVMDRCTALLLAGQRGSLGRCFTAPIGGAARMLLQQANRTERPDALNWRLAAIAYVALAAIALALIPFQRDRVLLDAQAGIVVWGSVEALTVVTVFLHGWSANALLPLIGGYRYVAVGLSAMLVSMFVLIAAALPAESMRLQTIVASQTNFWNILWQPLGLALFVVLGMAVSLRGPLNYADSADLCRGTSSESAGTDHLLWEFARHGMLFAFSAMAATVFLGGYQGPWLPGPVWLLGKTLLVLSITLFCSHYLVRLTPSRMLSFIWVVLLPLSFLHLLVVGLLTL